MNFNKNLFCVSALAFSIGAHAQTFLHFTTTEVNRWKTEKAVNAKASADYTDVVKTDAIYPITTFRRWGTTFNEQDWKALGMLTRDQQDEILSRAFSPEGELGFSMGRISMNANDYALDWYSCN